MTLEPCEYFLIQYAPSALDELRVPIGVILLGGSGRLVRCELSKNWRTLRCLDPSADRAFLEALPAHFAELVKEGSSAQTAGDSPLRDRLLWMAENDSGTVQVSQPRGVETADPQAEFERLFREHVERRRPVAPESAATETPRQGSRRWILGRLRESLERHQLWDRLSRNVPVAEFTAPGDGFRIDFSWQPNGTANYLHALALEHDWNQAKVLSYTAWRIRQRIRARVTAVVADTDSPRPAAESCRRLLMDSGIALQPLHQLDGFLEGVRREMRAS